MNRTPLLLLKTNQNIGGFTGCHVKCVVLRRLWKLGRKISFCGRGERWWRRETHASRIPSSQQKRDSEFVWAPFCFLVLQIIAPDCCYFLPPAKEEGFLQGSLNLSVFVREGTDKSSLLDWMLDSVPVISIQAACPLYLPYKGSMCLLLSPLSHFILPWLTFFALQEMNWRP